jgi:HD-like signal output (HDOD) protein
MRSAPAVERATDLGLRVRQLSDLPPLSPVAQQLLAILANDQVEIGPLARTIELDPGLTARIVGLARSAFFGYPRPVYTVRDAVVRVLGLDTVKSLALTLALTGHFHVNEAIGLDLARYWVTSLVTAASARTLAARVTIAGAPDPDGAYLGGLLHNLGLLVMTHVFEDEMGQVLALAPGAPDASLTIVEQEVLGVDHHQVGGWLADRWHLPSEVVVVMEHHHEPEYRGLHWPYARLIGACSRLAEWRLDHEDGDLGDTALFEDLGIAEDAVVALRAVYEERFESLRELASTLAQAR